MARRRRLSPKVVASSWKFVRVVILPLREKNITLVERRKWLKETRLVVGKFP
jgi:hypothetical protein